jgi:pimeloyl-ACP methyl ester carboxylesterase
MGIYGRSDRIVDPKQSKVLAQGASKVAIRDFERSGHFPMLDEPERFYQALHEFLDNRFNPRARGDQGSGVKTSVDKVD